MKNYYRIILGRKNSCAEQCVRESFIGGDFSIEQDLGKLPDDWKNFKHALIPAFRAKHPEQSKIAAGLGCGSLYTIVKEIKEGDIVLSPNGSGSYLIGEVLNGYSYHPGDVLPHRRAVRWHSETFERSAMSTLLQNSSGSIGTISNMTKHAGELEQLITGKLPVSLISDYKLVEDPVVFELEKQLEDFLVQNWKQTELGKNYDIYQEEGQIIGQQYRTDTGKIDILAQSKDKKEWLVVELKKGRASDEVVGQVQRYMGDVSEEIAEDGQKVRGVIIALDDDLKIRRSLKVAPDISFYRYQVNFALLKG